MSDQHDHGTHFDFGGAAVFTGYLGPAEQAEIAGAIRDVVAAAPLFFPETRRGQKMSVRMTSAGSVGWISDSRAGS